MWSTPVQKPKRAAAAARSRKNHSKAFLSSPDKSCSKLLKPCKPKKRIRISGNQCERKPVKRYKLIQSCDVKKLIKGHGKPGRPPKFPHPKKPATCHKTLRQQNSKERIKAYRALPRVKRQARRRPKMSMMDVDDPLVDECPSDTSSLNLSEPVIVPRKPSAKRPMGLRAFLIRLFGLNTKRRPKPQPFQF